MKLSDEQRKFADVTPEGDSRWGWKAGIIAIILFASLPLVHLISWLFG